MLSQGDADWYFVSLTSPTVPAGTFYPKAKSPAERSGKPADGTAVFWRNAAFSAVSPPVGAFHAVKLCSMLFAASHLSVPCGEFQGVVSFQHAM